MGALDEPRDEEGIFERARSNPRLLIAIAAGTILILAWIGWAIYVTSDKGATAGLGVVIAWPAMLAALALISLPFSGVYLLIRRLATDSGPPVGVEATEAEQDDDSEDPAEEEGNDEAEEEDDEAEEEEGAGEESDDESESEPEASKAS